eukprot:gene12130-25454_t
MNTFLPHGSINKTPAVTLKRKPSSKEKYNILNKIESRGPETSEDDIEEIPLPDLNFARKDGGTAALTASFRRFQGCPPPPITINALGKDESAVVWWPQETVNGNTEPVTSWEVKRFRLESTGIWALKGMTKIVQDTLSTQYVIEGLPNGYLYRFTVSGRNSQGLGAESDPSNVVLVEAPLPAGWSRRWDEQKQRFYYCNIKTQQSSWNRPDEDPFFLGESTMLFFRSEERDTLKDIFKTEIHNYEKVSVSRLIVILEELGEEVRRDVLEKLIRDFTSVKVQVSKPV